MRLHDVDQYVDSDEFEDALFYALDATVVYSREW